MGCWQCLDCGRYWGARTKAVCPLCRARCLRRERMPKYLIAVFKRKLPLGCCEVVSDYCFLPLPVKRLERGCLCFQGTPYSCRCYRSFTPNALLAHILLFGVWLPAMHVIGQHVIPKSVKRHVNKLPERSWIGPGTTPNQTQNDPGNDAENEMQEPFQL